MVKTTPEFKTFAQRFPGYDVKGIKFFRGMEGDGFNATIYKDGKKFGLVINSATGGEMEYEMDDEAVAVLKADAKAWDVAMGETLSNWGPDCFVEEMIVAKEFDLKMRRHAKKNTVFISADTKPGSYRVYKAPFGPEAKAAVQRKFPEAIFLNEIL